jgi:hypothetical protein
MDITSNPWIITAADVAAGPLQVWPSKALIANVEFQGYIAPTDSATVNQANGKYFAFLQGAADLETVRTGQARHTDGISIPQGGITNGTVAIYHN